LERRSTEGREHFAAEQFHHLDRRNAAGVDEHVVASGLGDGSLESCDAVVGRTRNEHIAPHLGKMLSNPNSSAITARWTTACASVSASSIPNPTITSSDRFMRVDVAYSKRIELIEATVSVGRNAMSESRYERWIP
jgi:hypothetical protein